jgi:hypothetical protein
MGNASGRCSLRGPPPTLLLFVPFVPLSDGLVRIACPLLLVFLSTLGLRRLGLPLWFLAFPPLADAFINGNPDGLLFAAIVLDWGPVAFLGKTYSIIPMLTSRRWRAIAVSVLVLAATAPILPWPLFLAQLPEISGNLAAQAADMSAFGNPLLMVIGTAALFSLGLRRAGWLAVPVLWPATQMHYAAISVPGIRLPTAIAFSLFPVQQAYLIGVCIDGAWQHRSRLVTARDTLGRLVRPLAG